jgi:hypothetical protein
MSKPIRIDEYLETFVTGVIREAMNAASADQWRRRAEQFEAVGTPRCDQIAEACRNHAALWDGSWTDPRRVVCPICGTPTSPWSCSCGETRVA